MAFFSPVSYWIHTCRIFHPPCVVPHMYVRAPLMSLIVLEAFNRLRGIGFWHNRTIRARCYTHQNIADVSLHNLALQTKQEKENSKARVHKVPAGRHYPFQSRRGRSSPSDSTRLMFSDHYRTLSEVMESDDAALMKDLDRDGH